MKLKPGDVAPSFQVTDVHGETHSMHGNRCRPTLLSFYRHAGCPPCNLRVHELMLASEKLDQYNVQILSVFESTPEHIRKDLAHGDVPFPILPDRERHLYRKYAVNTSLSGFLSSFLLRLQYSMKAIFKYGYFPRFAEATTMMPADFLVAPDGRLKLVHYGKDLGDYLAFDTLYSALDELSAISTKGMSAGSVAGRIN